MSFREITMIEVRETLRRWSAGQSFRAIARETGEDRKTVGRYVAAAVDCGFKRGDEVSDELVCKVSELVQERPLPPPSGAVAGLASRAFTARKVVVGGLATDSRARA